MCEPIRWMQDWIGTWRVHEFTVAMERQIESTPFAGFRRKERRTDRPVCHDRVSGVVALATVIGDFE